MNFWGRKDPFYQSDWIQEPIPVTNHNGYFTRKIERLGLFRNTSKRESLLLLTKMDTDKLPTKTGCGRDMVRFPSFGRANARRWLVVCGCVECDRRSCLLGQRGSPWLQLTAKDSRFSWIFFPSQRMAPSRFVFLWRCLLSLRGNVLASWCVFAVQNI